MSFADLDDFDGTAPPAAGSRKRAEITAARFESLAAKHLPCGIFLLTLTDGSQRKFRVRLERGSFCTGQRTLSIFRKLDTSDDHTQEWETLGVVSPTGFMLFKRWRTEWEARWAAAVWALASDVSAPGYSMTVDPRCWLTMHKLKTPEAIKDGLTPGSKEKLYPKPKRARRKK